MKKITIEISSSSREVESLAALLAALLVAEQVDKIAAYMNAVTAERLDIEVEQS